MAAAETPKSWAFRENNVMTEQGYVHDRESQSADAICGSQAKICGSQPGSAPYLEWLNRARTRVNWKIVSKKVWLDRPLPGPRPCGSAKLAIENWAISAKRGKRDCARKATHPWSAMSAEHGDGWGPTRPHHSAANCARVLPHWRRP